MKWLIYLSQCIKNKIQWGNHEKAIREKVLPKSVHSQ